MSQENPAINTLKFYSFIACPYAIRTRITLEELQIPYEYNEIDLLSNRHLSKEYIEINPMHKVPALKTEDGEIIYESLICCDFLDQNKVLQGKDRLTNAKIQMWVKFYDSNITTAKWNMLRYLKRGDQQRIEKFGQQIQEDLKTLARRSGLTQRIKENRDSYFLGPDFFSLLDIGVFPLLNQDRIIMRFLAGRDILEQETNEVNFNGNKNSEDLEALKIWLEKTAQRPSIQKSIYQIEVLPSWSESPLMEELQIQNPSDWDFERFYTEFAIRKFLGGSKPKL